SCFCSSRRCAANFGSLRCARLRRRIAATCTETVIESGMPIAHFSAHSSHSFAFLSLVLRRFCRGTAACSRKACRVLPAFLVRSPLFPMLSPLFPIPQRGFAHGFGCFVQPAAFPSAQVFPHLRGGLRTREVQVRGFPAHVIEQPR